MVLKGVESESGIPSVGYSEWARLNEKLDNICVAKAGYEKYLELEPNAWNVKFVSKRLGKLKCATNPP